MRTGEWEESVIQNLKDAGCDSETIEGFLAELRGGKEANGMKRLNAHRKALLDALHHEQTCIDCLDYLIYEIKKMKRRS